MGGLTAVAARVSVGSGKVGRRRDGEANLRRPKKGMTAMAALRGAPTGFLLWRGVARGGGAAGHPS